MGLINFDNLIPQPKRVEFGDDHFYVRPILAKDIIELQKQENITPMEYGLKLITTCCCDDAGNPIITREQAENLPPDVMQKITTIITETLGLGEQKN
jgi:hypothetical protein